MAGYKGHLVGGLFMGGMELFGLEQLRIYQPDLPITATLMGVVLLGALFPDVDTDSKGQRLFYAILIMLDLVLMIKHLYKWAAILGFCGMLPGVGRHRGWTHTWWAMLLVPLPIIILPKIFYHQELAQILPFYLAAVSGYFSHLLIDRKF